MWIKVQVVNDDWGYSISNVLCGSVVFARPTRICRCEIDTHASRPSRQKEDKVWRIGSIECINVFLPFRLGGITVLEQLTLAPFLAINGIQLTKRRYLKSSPSKNCSTNDMLLAI